MAGDQAGKLTRALYMSAAHCQGGHSDAGVAAAEALDVPFPITMPHLVRAALRDGFDPEELWPWLVRMNPSLIVEARTMHARAAALRRIDTLEALRHAE